MLTPAEIIATLDLRPHPEGGHYRETFRDPRCQPDGGNRSVSTAIYFLLQAGECSHWHRVDAAELWHWYAGAPLDLITAHPMPGDAGNTDIGDTGLSVIHARLGPDLPAGERPQRLVPAGVWQSARSLGDWTLVGCTVAPGFEFTGFEMAPPGWQPARNR